MITNDDLRPKLDEAVRDLIALEREIDANETVSADQRARLADVTNRLKDMLTGLAEAPKPTAAATANSGGGPKYPAIEVELSDLQGSVFPILRRASYAMSDAGVDDSDIDRYKADMQASSDPVAVTKSWVTVTDR